MITYVIGVDPGDTTGLCVWMRGNLLASMKQLPHDQVGDALQETTAMAPEAQWVFAVERFVFGGNTHKRKGATKTAPPLIGELRRIANNLPNGTMRLRGASEAKSFAPNARLKKLNWYTPGQQHANDGARQVVLCIAECWPSEFERLLGVKP